MSSIRICVVQRAGRERSPDLERDDFRKWPESLGRLGDSFGRLFRFFFGRGELPMEIAAQFLRLLASRDVAEKHRKLATFDGVARAENQRFHGGYNTSNSAVCACSTARRNSASISVSRVSGKDSQRLLPSSSSGSGTSGPRMRLAAWFR
jgi:hypothetical protein